MDSYSHVSFFFGIALSIGGLEAWLGSLEDLLIVAFVGFAVGAIRIVYACSRTVTHRNMRTLISIAFYSAAFVGLCALPVLEYCCENMWFGSSLVARAYYDANPELFTCTDFGQPFMYATDSAVAHRYVDLTNELYRLAFLQGCVDKSIALLVMLPYLLVAIILRPLRPVK